MSKYSLQFYLLYFFHFHFFLLFFSFFGLLLSLCEFQIKKSSSTYLPVPSYLLFALANPQNKIHIHMYRKNPTYHYRSCCISQCASYIPIPLPTHFPLQMCTTMSHCSRRAGLIFLCTPTLCRWYTDFRLGQLSALDLGLSGSWGSQWVGSPLSAPPAQVL